MTELFYAVIARAEKCLWPRTTPTRWNRWVFGLASRGGVIPAVTIILAFGLPLGHGWAKVVAVPGWHSRMDVYLTGLLLGLLAMFVALRATYGLSIGEGFVLQPNIRRLFTLRPRGTLHLRPLGDAVPIGFLRTVVKRAILRSFEILGSQPGTELVIESPLVGSELMLAYFRRTKIRLPSGDVAVVTFAEHVTADPIKRSAFRDAVAAAARAGAPHKDRSRTPDGDAPWGRVRMEVRRTP